MYPDRATFQRMVKNQPGLSGPGQQTLLALYDGPLRLREILTIVNTHGKKPAEGKPITESALRKRLDLLIAHGIIARAGSERTVPYYYIRRPWLFNQYILAKCAGNPPGELRDLTILLHELSHMTTETSHPHPGYIAAAGARAERSHQIETAYQAFKNLLGNKTAIGDYLEGIYEDIYKGNVPDSDLDGLIARDFLRFVATAPDEEREVRLFLWFADFFEILNRYEEARDALRQGEDLAKKQGLPLSDILADARILPGDLLLKLNDPSGAKEAFLELSRSKDAGPVIKAKALFGAGEIELLSGEHTAQTRFTQALELCKNADPEETRELQGNILRRTGTLNRLAGRLDEAEQSYGEADAAYGDDIIRGHVWLVPERAELMRARACSSQTDASKGYLAKAAAFYEEGKNLARRIRNVNWFAHCLIGECELARISYLKTKKPLSHDIATKYANAFEIYCQIESHWGIANTFIAEALLYRAAPDAFPDQYAAIAEKLEQAERFSRELGLKPELELIKRLKSSGDVAPELHPLVFL